MCKTVFVDYLKTMFLEILAHPLGAPQVRGLKDTRLRRVALFIPTVAMETKLITMDTELL